jgi:hypothetical protein
MTGLWTNDRDTLASGINNPRWTWLGRRAAEDIADRLIDTGVVRMLDPGDTELVERVARALAPASYGRGPELQVLDRFQLTDEGWRAKARAAIEALRQP